MIDHREATADAEEFIQLLETGGAIIVPPTVRVHAIQFLSAKLMRYHEAGAVDAVHHVQEQITRPRRR